MSYHLAHPRAPSVERRATLGQPTMALRQTPRTCRTGLSSGAPGHAASRRLGGRTRLHHLPAPVRLIRRSHKTPHGAEQAVDVERLGNTGKGPESLAILTSLRFSGYDHHGDLGELRLTAPCPQERPPVHDGHHHVEDDGVGPPVAYRVKSLSAVAGDHNGVLLVQDLGQEFPNDRVIVDDENPLHTPPVPCVVRGTWLAQVGRGGRTTTVKR